MSTASAVREVLARARRRVAAQIFFFELGVGALLAGAVLVLTLSAQHWGRGLPFSFVVTLACAAVGALLFALVQTARRWPGELEMAVNLDKLGRTHDRLTTALSFRDEAASPMQAMAQRECVAFLAGKDFRSLLPWRLSPAWRWLLVPVIAVALLRWDLSLLALARDRDAAIAQEKTSPTVEALRALARELEAKAKENKDPELKKLAEEVAKRAERLHATTDPAEAKKAALRELSGLEQLAENLRHPPKALTPEELKQIAEALQKAEATKQAAEKMQAGDPAGAADELERAARQAAVSGENSEAGQAESALREALERLSQQNQLSKEMQQQLSPGAQSALKKLADALRKMPSGQGSQPGKSNSQSSQESLEKLLSALQNMKFGEGQPGKPGADAKAGGPPQVVQISPAPSENGGAGLPEIPSGQPGSEKDKGTTKDPFGSKQESANKGADLAIRGEQASKGESYSQSLPGGLDTSRSTREYKQLYDSLAPAAENAVLQEDIPLGSRLFIKRYFESIRPTQ